MVIQYIRAYDLALANRRRGRKEQERAREELTANPFPLLPPPSP